MESASNEAEGSITKMQGVGRRLHSYDLLKGFLVEVMIVYHSVNYFGDHHRFLKYIDFVTGAFVFLSGRMVTNYYLKEYHSQPGLMLQRLLARSVKLLIIFMVVNTCVHLMVKKNYNGVEFGINHFYSNLYDVFIFGSKYLTSFEILLPIAYTLAIGGILALIARSKALLAAMLCVILGFFFCIGDLPFNLKFLAVGLGGTLYGCFRQESVSEHAKGWLALIAVLLVAAYMITVTFIDRDNLVIYFVGVCSVVQCISMTADKVVHDNWLIAMLKLFGRYSLFSYLLQILLLQFMFRVMGREVSGGMIVIIAILITNLLLYLAIDRLSSVRGRYQLVQLAYQKVFA